MNRHSDRLLSERMRGASAVFAFVLFTIAILIVLAIVAGSIVGSPA